MRSVAVAVKLVPFGSQIGISYFAAVAQVGVAIAVLVALCSTPVLVALLSALLLRTARRTGDEL